MQLGDALQQGRRTAHQRRADLAAAAKLLHAVTDATILYTLHNSEV